MTVRVQVYTQRDTQSRFATRKVQALVSYRLEEHGTFRSSSKRASETFKNDTPLGSPEIQRDRYSGGLLNSPFSRQDESWLQP